MQKYGYAESLIAGSIASGSYRQYYDPPSFVFVLYGFDRTIYRSIVCGRDIARRSAGLFIHLFGLYVESSYPQMGPPGPKYGIKEKCTH